MAGKRDLELARLFYTIEANTKGLKGELDAAERSFGRLTKFVRANPVAALGALAAAAVSAGIAAARMAEQFDTSVRKIAATIPKGTARLLDLKKAADQLSTVKGLSSDVVLSGLSAIAKEGVTSIEALTARFEALQMVADATGSEVTALAGRFDQILDVFGLADTELQHVGASLAAISLDRGVGFEDLLDAFQSAAPVIRDTGLSFDEGAAAISRLLQEGLSAKQVAAELKEQVETLGREGMRALAQDTRDATKDLGDLQERARAVEESMERAKGKVSADFAAATREIGTLINENVIQPFVRAGVLLAAFVTGVKVPGAASASFRAGLRAAIPGFGTAPRDPTGGFNFGSGTGLGDPLAPPPAKKPPPPLTPQELKRLRDQATDAFTDTLPTTIEATVVAIGRLGERLLALGTPVAEVRSRLKPLTDELGRLMEASDRLRDAERAADLSATTEHLEEIVSLADTTLEQRLAILDSERAATAESANQAADAETIIRLQARLAALDTQILRLRKEQVEANKEGQEFLEGSVGSTGRLLDATGDLGRQLTALARGAIGFAQALGIAEDNAAALLQNVITVGENLPDVISQVNNIGKKDAEGNSLFDAVAFAGGVTAILGGLAGFASGLFGESADDKRDREIREQNTEAIRALTKTLNNQVSGATVTSARIAVDALQAAGDRLRRQGRVAIQLDQEAVNRTIAGLGIEGVENLRDLQDILDEIAPGLQLNTSSFVDFEQSLRQVQRALAEVNFRAFAETFAGQLSLLQAQFDLLDLTNPLDQLAKLQELAGGEFGSPALAAALGGLDLSDPAQRAEAERRIQDLFTQATTGTGLTAEQLGGLSSEDLIDFLRTFEALLDSAGEQDGTTASGPGQRSFGVVASVTAVQADRLLGINISQDAHLVEIRDLLRGGAAPFTPVLPPPLPVLPRPLPESLGLGGGIVINLGGTVVEVQGGLDEGKARTIGQTAAQVQAETIARALGSRLALARLRAGDAVVRA